MPTLPAGRVGARGAAADRAVHEFLVQRTVLDQVAQAVSLWRAVQTQSWRAADGSSERADDAQYAFGGIDRELELIDEPTALVVRDLLKRPADQGQELLGYPLPDGSWRVAVAGAPDLRAHNTPEAPDTVRPAPLDDVRLEDGVLRVTLPAHSFATVRLTLGG